jgi:hypothetical protein
MAGDEAIHSSHVDHRAALHRKMQYGTVEGTGG